VIDQTTPVFLFSLPRSGSTLVQRMLSVHPEVATTAEPWFLLPLLYSMRRPGVYAEYGHRTAVRAIDDFVGSIRGGQEAYLEEVRTFALNLYSNAASGSTYFLDKTPRYHLVVEEIKDLFPEARFIFLWRQPLAVAASIIDSFGRGQWNLEKYEIDLKDGLDNLVSADRANDPRCHTVRFEDVVRHPDATMAGIFRFLELNPDDANIEQFTDVRLAGRMGDRTGVSDYTTVASEPLLKWRHTMNTAFRKRWCRQYLERVGRSRVEHMGYSYDELSAEVERLSPSLRHAGSDVARSGFHRTQRRFAWRLMYPGQREAQRAARARAETTHSA
jgi:hypothetical protein